MAEINQGNLRVFARLIKYGFDEEKKILEQELKDAADRVSKETSVVRPPIDCIGIGKDTKGMNLTEALNKALSDMYRKEENNDE